MSITSASMNQAMSTVQSVEVGTSENQKKVKEETVRQPETTYNAVSSQGDILTISEAGKTANSKMDNQNDDKSQSNAGAAMSQRGTENFSTESEKSTVNLSGYTEAELKQMYLDGDITKAEYEDEINSRNVNR